MKRQVLVIHGGMTFDTYEDYFSFLKNQKIDLDRFRKEKWSSLLQKNLGRNFDVLRPRMPNPSNSKYKEWSIFFRRIAPKITNNVILVGHSLGGIFLAKYLSENKFPTKIRATFLLAAPYNKEGIKGMRGIKESLGDFKISKNLKRLEKQGGNIFLYHSEDDKVVPFSHLERYAGSLPGATVRKFKKKGHFNQKTFPELVRNIKTL